PITWHGASSFDLAEPVHAGKSYGWSDAFGDAAIRLADADRRVWVLTPAMREGSGLVAYSRRHPDRYLDVGIAEDVAVTTAAGMALQGERPIVAIYSTFLQRGFDQVVHDVSIENLDVTFAIDRAGLVGGDGATHQGVYDLAYLRALPNLSVAMPRDATQMRAMLKEAQRLGGPKAVRWPRGSVQAAPDAPVAAWDAIKWGRGEVVKDGTDLWLLGLGPTVGYALAAAANEPRVGVVDARFVKPLDADLIVRLARSGAKLVTIEDHTLPGGFGSAVAELLSDRGVHASLERLGIPDVIVPHGDPKAQHEAFGFGPEALRERVRIWLDAIPAGSGATATRAGTADATDRPVASASRSDDRAPN
ncbi:MAG: transketolase C-terminal domain-containing protein, partial [Trueperaceae bacterium]